TLAACPRLKDLYIHGSLITKAGAEAFKRLKPDCEIHGLGHKSLAQSLKVKVGDQAPDLSLEDQMQSGEELISGWDGLAPQLTVLEFWATWCGPCTQALPHMNKLVEQLAPLPIRFVSITDEDRAIVQGFLRDHAIKAAIGIDTDGSMRRSYGINSMPAVVVISAHRTVLQIARPHELDISQLKAWAEAAQGSTQASRGN
ncbi:MAG: TlpA family protein disulfide reductase, partial [Phycisphaerales bacterium]